MTELSAAAEATWEAFNEEEAGIFVDYGEKLAAALRAVADEVVPWQPEPTEESVGPTVDFGYAWALFSKVNDVRQKLLAIADELEGHDAP
jgi:hypothetical protein